MLAATRFLLGTTWCATSITLGQLTRNFCGTAMASLPSAVVIAGPSGVGKGTLIERLREEYPALFGFSVSHTTRSPRTGEQDGVHYHFTSVSDIQAEIARGKFVEHAAVHGKYYGTSVAAVEAVRNCGKICILDIDVQGCRLVRQRNFPAKFIFIAPPSMGELEKRLRGRATDNEASVLKRLANAKGEIDAKDEPGLFDFVIVNDDLDKAYTELKQLLAEDISKASDAISP
jgi:guanylate kinase